MSAYARVPFFEAVRDATGGNPKVQRKRYLPEGPVLVLDQGQDFIAGYTTTDNAYTGELPVVLFGDHTRAFKYVDFPFALGADGVKALVPQEGFEASFLYWYFRNVDIPSAGYSRHFKFLRELSVCKPPLSEQRRIVNILNRAAKIERLRNQAADRLREFVPALFLKMFGDPAANPMEWEVRVLEELCISAQYGTSKKASEHVGGIPILRMGNVTYDGYLDCDSNNLKYAELEDSEIEKYALHSGDILFNRTNSTDLVGKTGIWDGRFEAVPASYFIRLRVDHAVIHPTYVWAYMNSSAVKRRLFEMARGAIGQANINAKELKSMPLPVPPLALQLRYVEICEAMKSTTKVTQLASRTAASLAASLLSCLLESVRMPHRVTKAVLP